MSRGPMPEAQAPVPPPGAPGEAEAPPAFSRKWWVLVTVMVGTFMGPFDGSVVNIALPRLTEYFGVGVTTVEWVVVAYLLTVSTFLLTFGRLGDMIGLKKIYLAGFAIFVLGSGACALAWNIWALVGFRVLQALGAGMLFAVGPAIVTHAFPPTERGKALGFVGVSVAVGLALGPTLGGFLIGIYDWHLIFLVNLPVGLFALVLAWRVLSYDEPHDQRFDPLGSVTSFVALFPLLLALSRGEAWGWDSPLVLGLFVLRPVLMRPAPASGRLGAPGLLTGGAAEGGADAPAPLTGEIDDGEFDVSHLSLISGQSGAGEDIGTAATFAPALGEAGPRSEDPVARLRALIGERQEETVEILRTWLEGEEERT